MPQDLNKFRVSRGSMSYAEVPIKERFDYNGNTYECVEHVVTKGVHGIDRCDYCKLEHTDICDKLRCTNKRTDNAWVYFIQVNVLEPIVPMPEHHLLVPIKRVIIK